jgi:ribosomal protein L37AE/L43A
MQAPVLELSSTVECPKCGKKSIVSHQTGVYQCLNCDFERNLGLANTETEKTGGLGEFLFAMAGFLLTAVLIL